MTRVNNQANTHAASSINPAAAPRTGAASRWLKALKAVFNTPAKLIAMPQPDIASAFIQAQRLRLTDCADAKQFLKDIRQRLREPESLIILCSSPADRSGWLPAMVQPLLSDRQQQQLICRLLNLSPQDCLRLAREYPPLWHTLIDLINQAAADNHFTSSGALLPQLLRSGALSRVLSRLHPQLPLAFWAAQLLWQIHRQGIVNALDNELRIQLYRCLIMLDGAMALPETARQALAGDNLWRLLDNWLSSRLPELAASREAAEQKPVYSLAEVRLATESRWRVNSAINLAAQSDTQLLVEAQHCYELLQRQAMPVNFAVGCAAAAHNHTRIIAAASDSRLIRTLVINDRGELLTRLQLESGETALMLRGVTIPSQARPQRLRQIAGDNDQLTFFNADNSAATALSSTLQQLEGQLSAVDATETSAAGSAWPLTGASAQTRGPAVVDRANVTGQDARLSINEFIYALDIKYADESQYYSSVVITQTRGRGTRDVFDREVAFSRGLEMMLETEPASPRLLLNFHPAWSKNLADDIHHYLSGKISVDYNASLPMDWHSPQNQRAAWLIGVGHGRKIMDNLSEMMKKIHSPLWNSKLWFNQVLRQLLSEHGGDPREITTATPVQVFLRIPSVPGRQHIPLDRQLDGSLQPLYKENGGNYTLLDIMTGEFRRGNIRAESKILQFPAGINPSLQQALQNLNLQRRYIDELKSAFADGEMKQGMTLLFKTFIERAIESVYQNLQPLAIPFTASAIQHALAAGNIYQLNWFGYLLHNFLFISVTQENKNKQSGIIISLWDNKAWSVTIDLLSVVSCYDPKKTRELLSQIEKSLPIPGRVKSSGNVGIYNNQIVINTSGRYQIEFHGKTFVKKRWQPPVAERSVLSLIKTAQPDSDALNSFVHTLQLDMNYLVLTPTEHRVDTAIEVIHTIGTLISFFTLPMAITSAVGGTNVASRLLAHIGSWKSSALTTTVTSVFPNLIKHFIADRPEDRVKAGIEAMLILGSEGATWLLNKYGVRTLSGLIYQGDKAVRIGYDLLPESLTVKINYYSNRFFLSYRTIILRSLGMTEIIDEASDKYEFPFIDVKAPAPIKTISDEMDGLAAFIAEDLDDVGEVVAFTRNNENLINAIQRFLYTRGYNSEVGAIISWDGIEDSQPVIDFIVRVNSPAPDLGSAFSETEDVLIESGNKAGKFSHLIIGEDQWRDALPGQLRYQNKAVCIKWFDDMPQAKSWQHSMMFGRKMNMQLFDRIMVSRPQWYRRSIMSARFHDLERRQSAALQLIYQQESEISLDDVKIYGTDSLSLKLSYLYNTMSIVGVDLLAGKFQLLSEYDLSMEPTALPEGNFIVIPTELRGVDFSNPQHVTLTNYAEARDLLLGNKIQGFLPEEMIAAGRKAISSCLYAPGIDRQLQRQKRQYDNPLLTKRLTRLAGNAAWLHQNSEKIRLPLLLVVDRDKLNNHDVNHSHQMNATIPGAAISFVLTLSDQHEAVGDILSTIRETPLPVSALKIQMKPAWQKTLLLAHRYAMFPEVANARPGMIHDEYQPWLPIIDLQHTGGLLDAAGAEQLSQQISRDDYLSFLGEKPQRITDLKQLGSVQPGARLLFLDESAGPGQPPLSHAMMMLEPGQALGANNQLIGGQPGWEIIWLPLCHWIEDEQSGFVVAVDGCKYSLYAQSSARPVVRAPLAAPVLHPQAVRAIALAEQYVAQPVGIAGVSASWEKILFLFRHGEMINSQHFAMLSQQIRDDDFQLFLGAGSQLARSQHELLGAPPGSRLIFFEPAFSPAVKPRMVHAMIVSDWGVAIGFDNQRFGGGAGWHKLALDTLVCDPDTRHGLMIEGGERQLHCIISPPLSDALFSAG